MSAENLAHLQKPPHQSFLRERFLSTELHRRPREDRNLEENLAALALYVAFGDDFYDAKRLRPNRTPPIENALMPEMMYRSSDPNDEHSYEWNEFSPEGICFPMDGTTGLVYEWSEFRLSKEIKEIHLEDGELRYVAQNGEKILISDHHGWIRLVAHDGREWNIDLASHQFLPKIPNNPDGHIRVVMQGLGHKTDPAIPGVNWQTFTSPDDRPIVIPNARSLEYRADPRRSAPLMKLDWKKVSGGRIELLVGAMGLEPGAGFGDLVHGTTLTNNSYPKGFNHKKVAEGDKMMNDKLAEAGPSGLSIDKAYELIQRDIQTETELSVEGLGTLIEELMDQCSDDVLMKWAMHQARGFSKLIAGMTYNRELREKVEHASDNFRREGKLPTESLDAAMWQRFVAETVIIARPEVYKENSVNPSQAIRLMRMILGIINDQTTGRQSSLFRHMISSTTLEIAELEDKIHFSLDLNGIGSARHSQYISLHMLHENSIK